MKVKTRFKHTEIGPIPQDWGIYPFADLGTTVDGDRGINYPGQSDFSNHGFCLFLSAKNVTRNGFRFDDCIFVSENKDKQLNQGKLERNDIVLTTRGTVGNFAYFGQSVPFENIRINSGMIILRLRTSELLSNFLYEQVKSQVLWKQIEKMVFGSAQPQLTARDIKTFKILVPPLPEQRAIANALSDVDALINSLDRLITKKRDIKQATMQQLLTGKTRLPGFTGEWVSKRFGDIADIDTDNLGSSTNCDYAFKYISLEDVDRGSLTSYTEQQFSSAPSRARRKLVFGDILVSTVRPTLQSHLLFRSTEANWICSTGFSVARCKDGLANPHFVFFSLFGNSITKQIETLLTGSNYPAINGGDVKRLEILLPSPEEQAAISNILSDMDSELSTLERRRDKTILLKQGMMQELLTGRTRLV